MPGSGEIVIVGSIVQDCIRFGVLSFSTILSRVRVIFPFFILFFTLILIVTLKDSRNLENLFVEKTSSWELEEKAQINVSKSRNLAETPL